MGAGMVRLRREGGRVSDSLLTVRDRATLSATPKTVHLVRGPMLSVEGGVVTWCGRRGFGQEPTVWSWRTCQKCVRGMREAP